MDAEVVGKRAEKRQPVEMNRAPTEMWLHLVPAAEIEHPVLKKTFFNFRDRPHLYGNHPRSEPSQPLGEMPDELDFAAFANSL